MKKLFLRFTLLGISIASVLITYKFAFFIAEKYFFDKVMYRKSDVFGYWKNSQGDVVNKQNSFLIEHRIKDLKAVLFNSGGQVLGLNNEGQKNEYKIVVIGDSIVYGMGVREKDRFSNVLESELNKIRPTRVFVLAQPGDDLVDNYTKFLRARESIDPDLYIFTLVDNDLVFNPPDWIPENQQTLTFLKSGCPQPDFEHPEPAYWPSDYSEVINKLYFISFLPQYSPYCVLKKVAQVLPKEKSLFFTVLPYTKWEDLKYYSTLEESRVSYIWETYIQAFREEGSTVLDVNDVPHFYYEPISDIEGHPTPRTHKAYADLLYREITTNPGWKFIK